MKKIITIALLLFVVLSKIYPQKITQQEYLDDLSFIYKNLQKTPSFKTQKENQKKVRSQFERLQEAQKNDIYLIEALVNYYSLLDCLQDYHNVLNTNSSSYTYQDLQNKDTLKKIINETDGYYRKSPLNLDSLERELANKTPQEYEGIYFYHNLFKVAVVQSESKLVGIILDTKIPSWSRGEEMFYLIPKEDNNFRIVTGSFIDKKILSTLNRIQEGEFLSFGWSKRNNKPITNLQNPITNRYQLKQLQPEIDYLKISTFGSSTAVLKEATTFYNDLKEKNLAQNLIVDLQNNGGGADKNSDMLRNILTKYSGKIYILMNYYTASNAEEFVVRIKGMKNVTVLGQKTKGVLTYGRNYDTTLLCPSKKIKISFTDLKDNWQQYLPFEGIGVEPDISLTSDRDWIEQTLAKIKGNSSS
jgi:hypothetical protein